MLLSFTVENFKSIRDLQTLSLEARSDDHLAESNVIVEGKTRALKSVALFGPNASGKSNMIEAMVWFRQFVLNSSKEGQVGQEIDIVPFRLSTATEKTPTHFEVEFLWKGQSYRYGFDVTRKEVVAEWLYRSSRTKPAMLFTRDGQEFDVSSEFFKEGKGLEARTRDNALFLSVCAQWNGPVAREVLNWMRRFRHVSGLSEIGFLAFTAERLQDPRKREKLLKLAQTADFNICGLRSEIEQISESKLPPGLSPEVRQTLLAEGVMRAEIKTSHMKLDGDGKPIGLVEFDLSDEESQGTQKFIALTGPITHTLEEGAILVVDELEARLHPLLTQAILALFHGPANPLNAQLICATHDVMLMDPQRLRRDQIWFCAKDERGATDLYTLADFDPDQVRPTTKFSRQYLLGIFGAVPKLAHFEEAAIDGVKG